ncbi:Disease resistance protein [Melia azedarach]|uniref:Disease resistance protein n=1 Tax=Melia azedarach TaxID=155640 RepID=A0ACC1XJ17_MELAZ|nr:Disease resistance protein [Melia azedarach]
MSIIVETVLTVSIELLLQKLASKGVQLFASQEQIQADLKNWERKLGKIKAVLDDAEERMMMEQSVNKWLCELESLAYDVEDLLDEFSTEALRRNLLLQSQSSSKSKLIRNFIPTCCTNLTPSSLKFNSMMRHKIEEITLRLQNIATEKDQLELKQNSQRSKKVSKRQDTTSLVIEAEVHGREDEKKEIVELLLKDDLSADGGLSVIPITGMGGLGKTTLAQLVFNDKTVESHFDLTAWACVSEDYDPIRVTKAILKSIDVQTANDDDLNSLQGKLKNELSGKKFFLVLDDMWNENYGDWTNLKLPLVVGAPGSKIIVTSRSQIVASKMGTITAYELKQLSNDSSLLVFTQHSLGTRDFSKHPHLKDIGEKIVKKCNGLPLATKTLGGLLRGKYNLCDWENVLNNKIWDLPEEGSDIMRILRVSYYYLPAHLKRCFAFCSLLPKDYEFSETEIVLLWMAEGLLQHDASEKEIEDSGHYYFKELQSRSFFQQSSMDTSRFVMHDLINDLAQWAAGEIYLRIEDKLGSAKQQNSFKHLRHLSYVVGEFDGINRFDSLYNAKHLRTFLPMELTYTYHYLSYDIVYMLLACQRLRVLSLRGYRISGIPNSVGNLKHLRHLDLSGTQIVTLPEAINTLYNLRILLLEDCFQLKKLCEDMGNLVELCHLNNSNVHSLEEMPLGIGKLTCLQTLRYFVVGKNIGFQLRELKSLEKLQGKLKISGLENVKDVADSKKAELNGKRNLTELFLEWNNSSADDSREPETETTVLERLRPHVNLKELTIKGYGGSKFPIWLGDTMFSNLVLIRFENCGVCTALPSLGQLPSLKHLFIIRIAGVKSVGPEFYGDNGSVPFPSLETLYFENIEQWEDWIPHRSSHEVEVFSRLKELSVVRCSKLLGKLPERLTSLERLVIQGCEQLLVSVPSIPTLCKLKMEGCKSVMWTSTVDPNLPNSSMASDLSEQVFPTGLLKRELPNLEELVINNIRELTYLWQNGSKLLQDISSLHQLKIADFPQLSSLLAEEEEEPQQQGLPCRLNYLELNHCQNLEKLPAKALLSLSSLRKIKISHCDSLKSLPDAWMHSTNMSLESLSIVGCNSLTYIARVRLPLSLKQMKIEDCEILRTLVDENDLVSTMEEEDINNDSSRYASVLEQLDVNNCPSLTCLLSKSKLPATLESIEVKDCSKLTSLSSRGNLSKALKYLYIDGCAELESVAEGLDNDTSLETIRIMTCQNLRCLPNNLHNARHLRHFELRRCRNLISFPDGGLPSAKLSEFRVSGCEKLEALPKGMQNLTSLQRLQIVNCPSMEPIPEDSLPTNIASLGIDHLMICKPFYEWRLDRFTCMREFSLYGECSDVKSFPSEDAEMALPATLNHLSLANFPKLKYLSLMVENLTSLESLSLLNCPNLEYFPDDGLPFSLLKLEISECPVISQKCKTDEGEYWPLIAHLPYASLDLDPLSEDD